MGLFLTTGCEDSTGPEQPESATISGTITFTGDWPAEGDVAVSLSSTWPPTGAPAASLVITESGTYDYTFNNVTFGTYASIVVSWENPDSTFNYTCNQSTLGAYGGTMPWMEEHGQGTNPDTIIVSVTNFELNELDLDANLDYSIPNPYFACQPACTDFTTEAECTVENASNLSMSHCIWDATNSSCGYKQ